MNEPEATMHDNEPKQEFEVLECAIEGASIALELARRVPAPLKSIADQLIRSASSVPANLSEGNGRRGRDQLHHWRIAYAEAKETDVHLRLLLEAKAIDRRRANQAARLFDRVRAMIWRLLHPAS